MHDGYDDTEPAVDDERRTHEDELIRQYLLAQAVEWADYERKYGFLRTTSRAQHETAAP